MFANFKMTKKTLYIILSIICITIFTLSKIFITNSFFLLKRDADNKKNINNIKEHYGHNIIYMSPNDAYISILDSGYLNKLNEKDMEIRKCDNLIKCQELYKNSLIEFNKSEKKELRKLINKTDEKLKLYGNLYKIPWKLCKFTDKIEEGMPHTHTDIIFLSNSFFRKNNDESKMITLIHEKIHVYQRKNKQKTEELYREFNFNKVENNKYKQNINLRRTNPDLDSFDYNYNGQIFFSEYKDDAKSLRDVETKFLSVDKKSNTDDGNDDQNNNDRKEIENLAAKGLQNEHPNEIFASIISEKIVKGELNKKLTNYVK